MYFEVRRGALHSFAVGLVTVLALQATALAQDVSLEGKRIDIITPTGTGGGGDAHIRFIAEWYGRYLPGKPTMVPRNIPGGGGLTGSNWFDANARPDGTAFFLVSPSAMLTYLLRPNEPSLKFDPRNWRAVVGSPLGRLVYVHSNTGIQTVEDLKNFAGELVMGLSSPTGSDMPAMLAMSLLGVKVRPISGIDGGEQALAFQRGELTMNQDTTSSYAASGKALEQSGTAVPLFSFGIANEDGEIERDPNFPDLPTWVEAYETVHGKAPDGPGYEAWRALHSIVVMSARSMVLPAGTPDSVYDAYVEASRQIDNDPEFSKEALIRVGNYPQSIGVSAQRIAERTFEINDEARAAIATWLKEHFGIDP
jgi:tripartite-type tricarboxylate transporter receptor subunit TctC